MKNNKSIFNAAVAFLAIVIIGIAGVAAVKLKLVLPQENGTASDVSSEESSAVVDDVAQFIEEITFEDMDLATDSYTIEASFFSNNTEYVYAELSNSSSVYHSCVEEMKHDTSLTAGAVVYTKGFYSSGDGGAARYTILTSSNYSADGYRVIPLDNGLFAELYIENNTVVAEQLGAHGDGVSDDAPIMQMIVNYGYNIQLCKDKVYKFISDGLYITNPITITGNGATFLIDDSYAPTHEDMKTYFIRNKYGLSLSYFAINSLNIQVNFSNVRTTEKAFVVISPLFMEKLEFDRINVETSTAANSIICMWLNNGCTSFSLKNSKLINNTTGALGGALWATTKEDKLFQKFKSIDSFVVDSCKLYASSADEVFGVWGIYNINAQIYNTSIAGDIKAKGRTRIISVVSQGDNHANINVNFKRCAIAANCDTSSNASYYDSVFGIGTDYSSNHINVKMDTCTVKGKVYGPLLFPSCYRTWNVSRYDANNKAVNIVFNSSTIECSSTITGGSFLYCGSGVDYPTCAWDCEFNSCSINCGAAFAYLYTPSDNNYYVPNIVINKCNVKVGNANAFIYKPFATSDVNLNITSSTITASGVNTFITTQSSENRALTKQNNAQNQLNLSGALLNGGEVKQ